MTTAKLKKDNNQINLNCHLRASSVRINNLLVIVCPLDRIRLEAVDEGQETLKTNFTNKLQLWTTISAKD